MSLSSLIVQREIAPIRVVEEALTRQVLYGGDLATNLLEVATVEEWRLAHVLAESFGLTAAPAGELPPPTEQVLHIVPAELAIRRSMLPLEMSHDRLVLVLAEPLGREDTEQLSFALGLKVEQRIALLVRVREALARAYGASIEGRFARLLARLSGGPPPSGPSSRPPLLQLVPDVTPPPRPPSVQPPRIATPAPATVVDRPPPPRRLAPEEEMKRLVSVEPVLTEMAPPAPSIHDAVTAPPPPPRRRRGPLTLDVAKQEAEAATDRDTLLELAFDYCRQFFDYCAIFIVHGDVAEGRDAFGDGTSRERIVGLSVALQPPGVLRAARDRRTATLSLPDRSPGTADESLLANLGRARVQAVLVLPIVVRRRVVALLYGDAGTTLLDATTAPGADEVVKLVGQGFERLIVRKKLAGLAPGVPGPESEDARIDAGWVVPMKAAPSPPTDPAERAGAPANARLGDPAERPSQPPGLVELAPPPRNAVISTRPSGPPIPREEPPDLDWEIPLRQPSATVRGAIRHASAPELDAAPVDDEMARALVREIEQEEGGAAHAVAVGPHVPPPSMRRPLPLPSIIVDTDREYEALVERMLSGDEDAEGDLLRDGARAMPAIMAHFPGPTTAREALQDPLPPVTACGPILSLVARERRAALPFVLVHLASDNLDERTWATFLISELAYPEAVDALVPRLFDEDARVRLVARAAARALAPVAREGLLGALGKVLRDPRSSRNARLAALDTLGEVRDPLGVPLLIRHLENEDEEIATVARRSLITVTRRDFARDTKRWLGWWGASSDRHRIEWLIDALTDDTPGLRRAAGEELKAITRQMFGYRDDLPQLERERAQQRFRDWWASEGRARFLR